MKNYKFKIIFMLIIFFTTITTKGISQEKKSIIKTNLVGSLFRDYNLTYEQMLNEKFSLTFSGHYFNKVDFIWSRLQGGYGSIGYRYYVTNKRINTPSGFWLSQKLGGGYYEDVYKNNETPNAYVAFTGIDLGYQWALKWGLTIDLGTGINLIFQRENRDSIISYNIGALPSIIISLGYAF